MQLSIRNICTIILLCLFVCLPAEANSKVLRVVASFSILADMAQNVGGNLIEVTSLVGPDSDTHTYQPTPEDAKRIADADIILINGLGFEGWMERLIQASGTKAKIITATKGIQPRTIPGEGMDPHAWQDLANGQIYIDNITAALSAADAPHAAAFHGNAAHYQAELKKMDAAVCRVFADIPKPQRKIITSHDAFGYFGAAYGVTFLAPMGISTEAEPSAADVAKLIQQIKTEGIKQLFIENFSNPKLIQQIAKDTGATMGGTLYSDSLSVANGAAPSYLDMFRNNVPKMRAAMLRNKL